MARAGDWKLNIPHKIKAPRLFWVLQEFRYFNLLPSRRGVRAGDDAAACEFWGEELLDEDAVPDEHAPRAKTKAVPKENTESLRIKSPYR